MKIFKSFRNVIIVSVLMYFTASCDHNNGKIPLKKEQQNFLTIRNLTNEFIEYDIDTLASFREITKILEEIDCQKNYALFKLETKSKIFKIQPLQFCGDIFDYKMKQVIYINTDSITVNDHLNYPIDSLHSVLRYHLLNYNGDNNYPLGTERKWISINVDDSKKIDDSKILLLKIIDEVNSIDGNVDFGFMFENSGLIEVVEK